MGANRQDQYTNRSQTGIVTRYDVLYDIWYFSRLNICGGAATLTAAASIVLLGRLHAEAVSLVACATGVVYWLDDLLDRPRDEARYPILAALRHGRIVALGAAVLVAGWGAFALLSRAPWHVAAFLSVLAGITLAFCHWPPIRTLLLRAPTGYAVKPAVESLVWSLVCLWTPVLWAERTVTPQAAVAITLVWPLLHVVLAAWLLADGKTFDHPAAIRLGRRTTEARVLRTSRTLCWFAVVPPLVCTAAGIFPPVNLVCVAFPAIALAFLARWPAWPLDHRVYVELMIAANLAGMSVVALVY